MTFDILPPLAAQYLSQMWYNPWLYVLVLSFLGLYVGHRLVKFVFAKLKIFGGWIYTKFYLPRKYQYLDEALNARLWQKDEAARAFWEWILLVKHLPDLPEHQLVMLRANYAEFCALYETRGLWMRRYIAGATGGRWDNLDKPARLHDLRREYRSYCHGSGMLSRRRSLRAAGIPAEYLKASFQDSKVAYLI